MARRSSPPQFHLLAFDQLLETDDGYGGQATGWDELFQARGEILWLRGSESVQAARLQGRQPVVATIPRNAQSAQLTPEHRMRDLREGTIYNIRSVQPNREQPRLKLDVLCESGVAI